MAEKAGEAFVELTVHDRKLTSGLAKAQGRFSKFTSGMGAQAIGLGAALAAGIGGKKAIKAFATQEQAEKDLESAFAATGKATAKNVNDFKSFASEMQKLTTFGDELIIQQAAVAVNLGVSTDQIQGATKAAIGLTAKGIDLKTAFNLIAKASSGNTSLLSRYGIQLKSTGSDQDKFNELLSLGAEQFQTVAASADTFAARGTQVKNSFGDLGEVFAGLALGGGGASDGLLGLRIRVDEFTDSIKRLSGSSIGGSIGKFFGGFRDGIEEVGAALGALTSGSGESFKESLATGKAALQELRDEREKDFNSAKEASRNLNQALEDAKGMEVDNFIAGEAKKQAALGDQSLAGGISASQAAAFASQSSDKDNAKKEALALAKKNNEELAKQTRLLEQSNALARSLSAFAS